MHTTIRLWVAEKRERRKRIDVQDPYQQMYVLLFHAITDWTEQMQEMQQKAEALFM